MLYATNGPTPKPAIAMSANNEASYATSTASIDFSGEYSLTMRRDIAEKYKIETVHGHVQVKITSGGGLQLHGEAKAVLYGAKAHVCFDLIKHEKPVSGAPAPPITWQLSIDIDIPLPGGDDLPMMGEAKIGVPKMEGKAYLIIANREQNSQCSQQAGLASVDGGITLVASVTDIREGSVLEPLLNLASEWSLKLHVPFNLDKGHTIDVMLSMKNSKILTLAGGAGTAQIKHATVGARWNKESGLSFTLTGRIDLVSTMGGQGEAPAEPVICELSQGNFTKTNLKFRLDVSPFVAYKKAPSVTVGPVAVMVDYNRITGKASGAFIFMMEPRQVGNLLEHVIKGDSKGPLKSMVGKLQNFGGTGACWDHWTPR